MDQPTGEVAAVVPNLVALVAGDRKEPWRHSLVLNARRRMLLCQKSSGRIVCDVGRGLDREVCASVRGLKALTVTVGSARCLGKNRGRKVNGGAALGGVVSGPSDGLGRSRQRRGGKCQCESCPRRFHRIPPAIIGKSLEGQLRS